MNTTSVRLATLLLAVVVALPARAADLRDILTDYNVTAWGDKDGLPRGTIWALAQDYDGYLWIGSEYGLVRFDGFRFTTWEALGNPPLPTEAVRALCASSDGSLWVGFGSSAGIARIRGRHVHLYTQKDGLRPGEVTSLVEDRTGVIWAAHGEGLYRFASERWHEQPELKGRVRQLHVGATGRVFVIHDRGVFVSDKDRDRFEQVEPAVTFITDISEDARANVWLTDQFVGVRRLGEPLSGTSAAANGVGSTLLSDRSDNLWLGTSGQGLWRADHDATGAAPTFARVTTLTGLSNDIVGALLEDRDGNIWAGTADGLNRLTRHPFRFMSHLGLVNGLEASADGTVWAATASGLVRFPRGGNIPNEQVVTPGLQVRAMHADGHGTLWVATDAGVMRYSGPYGSASASLAVPTMRRVRGIASAPDGGVWMYDLDRGIGRWDGHHLELISLPADLEHALICAIHADRSGRVWVGFRQGRVVAINTTHVVEQYGPAQGLDPGTCNAIYEDAEATIWVLGVHGLSRYANGRFTTLRRPGDVPLENLTGMAQERGGALWLTSLASIMRVDRTDAMSAVDGRPNSVRAQVFNATNGISGTAARSGRTVVRAGDRQLWFLTSHGVAIVDPDGVAEPPQAASVHVDSVVVDDQRSMAGLPPTLPPRMMRVEIDYSTPRLSPGPAMRLRYRLEGFDSDWHQAAVNQRRVAYTNLPPRSYRFRVESLGAGGTAAANDVWEFSVQPAFYQTTWFALVCVAGIGGIASVLWRLRLRQVRGEFALLLKERVRLSREIHDTLLQSLIGVALQLEQVEHDSDASAAGKAMLVKARRQVEEYIRDARESIWNLRSSALEREGLAAALRHAGERAITEARRSVGDTRLSLTVSGSPDRCAPEVEEQLLRIGQEAVINAARHGEPQQIRIELRYDDTSVSLRVADDGRGFDAGTQSAVNGNHWGLVNMRERAATLGGTLHIRSRPGSGTQIEATVPRHPAAQQGT